MKLIIPHYQMYLLAIILIITTSSPVSGQNQFRPDPPAGETWHLIFEDDFEAGEIDYTKWKREIQKRPNSRRDIFTYWVPDAYRIENSTLKIQTSYSGYNDAAGNPVFYSGGLVTKGKFTTGFSYMEARVKILEGNPGLNSSFWTMSEGVFKEDGSGQSGTEMDIIEMPWHTGRIQHALHWDGYGDAHQNASKAIEASPSLQPGAWVTVGLWWKPDEYIFYVNGEETWRTSAGGVSQAHNAHLLLTSMVLSPWGGIIDKDKMPIDYEVDYVRVYALTDKDMFSPLPLRDPGFEKGVWEYMTRKPAAAEFSYDTIEKIEGNQSLKCEVITVDVNSIWKINTSIALLLRNYSNYEITFSAKTIENTGARLRSRLYYGGTEEPEKFNFLSQYRNFNLTNEWQTFKILFTTEDLSEVFDQMQITFDFADVATYYLDDIQLTFLSTYSFDGSFENESWDFWTAPGIDASLSYINDSNAPEGEKVARVIVNTENVGWQVALRQYNLDELLLKDNAKYIVSYWAKSDAPNEMQIRRGIKTGYDHDLNEDIVLYGDNTITSDWTEYSYELPLTNHSECTDQNINFWFPNVGTYYIDNVKVVKKEYPLTVNNGSGSGEYAEGAVVEIEADAPPEGEIFDMWTGDVETVADIDRSITTIIMPASGISVSATFMADTISVGIISPGSGGELSLYPNPASREVRLVAKEFKGETYVSIIDINGTVLKQELLGHDGELIIETASLPKGTYLIRVASQEKIMHIRLVVI